MKKINLVIIPYNDFLKGERFGFRSRDQHLFLEIARDERINKIIIVERPRSIVSFLLLSRLRVGAGEKLSGNMCKVGENFFLFEFFAPGLEQIKLKHLWFDKVYGSLKFVEKFRDALKQIEVGDFVVLSFNPFANKFVSMIEPKFFAFDVMDNFCFHPEFSAFKNYICRSFEWVSSNSDLIFCVNEELENFFLKNYPLSAGKTFILPNGVDEKLMVSGSTPEDIGKIKSPRIGYVGVISDRIDFELVEYVARERKFYNFIFIGGKYGDVGKQMRRLGNFGNIYFLGDKHYSEIPDYIFSLDVCIVPHKINEFTLSNDPMKIYEYLYFGKPVVSTRISIQDEIKDHIFVAGDKDEFLKLLD
ncbi:MAG: glycosyltransferase, partial [Candidatus Kryptonium sp.]